MNNWLQAAHDPNQFLSIEFDLILEQYPCLTNLKSTDTNESKIITINQKEWSGFYRVWESDSPSMLLTSNNTCCCLGFQCLACGFSRDQIRNMSLPSSISFYRNENPTEQYYTTYKKLVLDLPVEKAFEKPGRLQNLIAVINDYSVSKDKNLEPIVRTGILEKKKQLLTEFFKYFFNQQLVFKD